MHCTHREQRAIANGFTLVELLVVIAIIGVLVALLLPAVQAARESARMSQCSSNLKNVALALQNYASQRGSLPSGGITNGNCCSTRSNSSWPIDLLPFIEQQALYDQYDFDEYNEALENRPVVQTPVALYNCPSDEGVGELDRPASGPGNRIEYARSSYRGNSGLCTTQSNAFWDSSSQQNEQFVHQRGPLHGTGVLRRGFSLTEPTALGQISDGLSHTILLGEKAHRATSSEGERRRTFWAYSYTSYNKSLAFHQTRSIIDDYERCLRVGGPFGSNPCKRSWGSLHPSGLHVAMVDGSVHYVRDSIDIFLFGDLSTIAGEESASLE